MQFYFIRHGQSANNALYLATGTDNGRESDPPLTGLGGQQAKALAELLARPCSDPPERDADLQNLHGFGLTHLYCSLMERSAHTAVLIGRRLHLRVQAWEDAHECGGIYLEDSQTGEHVGKPGRGREFFARHFPGVTLPEAMNPDGWWNRPWEDDASRQARARRFIAELLHRHGGRPDRVAVVSHGGFYNHVLAEILGLDRPGPVWFDLNNTGFTRFDFNDHGAELVYHNRLDHLPAELVT